MPTNDIPDLDAIDVDSAIDAQYTAPTRPLRQAPTGRRQQPAKGKGKGNSRKIILLVGAGLIVLGGIGLFTHHSSSNQSANSLTNPSHAAQLAAIQQRAATQGPEPTASQKSSVTPPAMRKQVTRPEAIVTNTPSTIRAAGPATQAEPSQTPPPAGGSMPTSAPISDQAPPPHAENHSPAPALRGGSTPETPAVTDTDNVVAVASLKNQLRAAEKKLADATRQLKAKPKVVYRVKNHIIHEKPPRMTVEAILKDGVVIAGPKGATKIVAVGGHIQ